MNLFETTGTLRNLKSIELKVQTWSLPMRSWLTVHADMLASVATAKQDLVPDSPYGITYVAMRSNLTPQTQKMLGKVADALTTFQPKNGAIVFENMMDDHITRPVIHGLFALLGEQLRNHANSRLAFHSPIESKDRDSGFPVHADLFGPRVLFNILTDETANGGTMYLLSLAQLESILRSVAAVPVAVRTTIVESMRSRCREDQFDLIYDLMYGDHPWKQALADQIDRQQIRIQTRAGSGYLMLDGQWMHGREAVIGPVTETRLQRLIFDNALTRRWKAQPRIRGLNTCAITSSGAKSINSKSMSPKAQQSKSLNAKSLQSKSVKRKSVAAKAPRRVPELA